MSKFDEMCEAYSTYRREYFEYEDECFKFANKLIVGMVNYFGIPKEQLKLVPALEEPKPNTGYYLKGAMQRDDAYWHVGVEVILYARPNLRPFYPLLIHLRIRKDDGKFIVKIFKEDPGHRIDMNSDSELEEFYDFVLQAVKDDFRDELQQLQEQRPVRRPRIGFPTPTREENPNGSVIA